MPDFLADDNSCGQTILQLVSRGNAIIAEILRLKDYVPNVYRLENKQDVQKYNEIILDFSYFKIAEAQEHKIENNEALQDLDEEFRDNHVQIIQRFFLAFKSIHTYVIDLNRFIEELQDGMFLHQTLETVFADMEGRQLLCEALYLYGTMLLIVDAHIEGIVRERLLVSHYRYTTQERDTQSCIDEVCKLLRDTGLTSSKKPNNYPEDYFRRISIQSSFIDIVIGRLRSDDIYNQLSLYPLPKHRSTALATQASMLYVCLFFSSNILHNQTSVMREIVDKYFPDNWIVSIYMGFNVNLIESWEPFRAAKLAMNNTLETSNVKSFANVYSNDVPNLFKTTVQLLQEGTITGDNLLAGINKIINILRDCNVTVRWLMLHTAIYEKHKKSKQIRDLVSTECKCENVQIFKLLLNTAQLELTTRDLFKNLLTEKEIQWERLKKESFESLVELSEVFGGTKPLTRVPKNPNLHKWFLKISNQVESLSQTNEGSSRKIVQLIQALEEVQEFHQLESHLQIVQYLVETRGYLHQMIRNMNIKEDVLITMQIIGDLSYAWEIIDSYTPIMQVGIKRDPNVVIKLRAVFLKLASALEIPLLRINQARSEDFVSVSQYYSSELEIYIRKVLQIIPNMMFQKLARIIEMQTSVLKELPTRLEKDKMREYAQLNERFEFAELTHSISVFSEGMRMMKSTLVGVICLDPKHLLEDGIRKELVQHITKALHMQLIFPPKLKPDEFEEKLKKLAQIMDGYKRSFEYIQDYININGLKIWQEEVTRIINYYVERECNGFLRNKVHDWESIYQSRYVPIPYFPPEDSISENFIGRLAREIIRLTDLKNTSYVEQTTTWYDSKTHKIVLNKQIVLLIISAIEVTGLVGLDRLFSFMIITNLQKIISILENKDAKNVAWNNIFANICRELKHVGKTNYSKFYQTCINRSMKLLNCLLGLTLNVGQLQLLRNLFNFHLNTKCKFDSKNLESSLQTFNKALLNDIRNDIKPNEEMLYKLSQYFDYTGMNNPFNKIYVTVKSREEYAYVLFVFVVCYLPKINIFTPAGTAKHMSDQWDGQPFIMGLHTIIKQFHSNLNKKFVQLMCQYVLHLVNQSISSKNTELPIEVTSALKFLKSYALHSKNSQDNFKEFMPQEILHLFHSLTI